MRKTVIGETSFYEIEWSGYYRYERIPAARILPDMPGIIHFAEKKDSTMIDLLFFASWREGVRTGMKNFFDPLFGVFPKTVADFKEKNLFYRYTIIDTSPPDMQDIFFWLMKSYEPPYNNFKAYSDSRRYKEISVKERIAGKTGRVIR